MVKPSFHDFRIIKACLFGFIDFIFGFDFGHFLCYFIRLAFKFIIDFALSQYFLEVSNSVIMT
jgi:hypothetical protein